jgi:hypothetical protein
MGDVYSMVPELMSPWTRYLFCCCENFFVTYCTAKLTI